MAVQNKYHTKTLMQTSKGMEIAWNQSPMQHAILNDTECHSMIERKHMDMCIVFVGKFILNEFIIKNWHGKSVRFELNFSYLCTFASMACMLVNEFLIAM